jgi:glutaredoxin
MRQRRGLAGAIGPWLLAACGPERPPAPDDAPAPASATPDAAPTYVEGQTAAVLTYAGERGQFADARTAADVPAAARGMVRVTLLDGPAPPPGRVWVANLGTAGLADGVPLETVERDLFEELAAGQGRSSAVELPPGIEPPEIAPAQGIVVYKTDWCGVCKQLLAYLDRKGVAYVAKDVEKDPKAAAELQAKAAKQGIRAGSVPMIDIGGELMVGFDRARLEQLL